MRPIIDIKKETARTRYQEYYAVNRKQILAHRKEERRINPLKRREIEQRYRDKHREEIRQRAREKYDAQHEKERIRHQERHQKLRIQILNHYKPICNCCGETELNFLCLDHIDGAGGMRRKIEGTGERLYRWIKKANYPKTFQVLCHNCNAAKGHYDKCPHQNSPILPKSLGINQCF